MRETHVEDIKPREYFGARERARDRSAVPFWLSLNSRGLVFLLFLLLYSAGLVLYVLSEKQKLLVEFDRIESQVSNEAVLLEANLAAQDTINGLFLMVDTKDRESILRDAHSHFANLSEKYSVLESILPEEAVAFKSLLAAIASGIMEPSIAKMALMKEQLAMVQTHFGELLNEARNQRLESITKYHQRSDAVTQRTLVVGTLGIIFLGIVTTVFLHHITGDIKKLELGIRRLMQGDRNVVIRARRSDELGRVIYGTNAMATTLANREEDLEIERSRSSYQEKMNTLSRLAAGLLHELRNPVSAMVGLCETIESEGVAESERSESITYIRSYAERLNKLTEDLARLAVRQDSDYGLVDLNEIVNNTCGHIRFDERWYSIKLDLQLDPNLEAIYGYEDQLSLMLLHLVSNAFDALNTNQGDGGTKPKLIRISTKSTSDEVEIEVQDSGCGMDRELLGHCQDSFYTTKDQTEATGLGLPLCVAVVSSHEGQFSINSEEGVGTTIRVVLPLGRPDHAPHRPEVDLPVNG